MRTKKLKDGLLIYSRKLPGHSGEFVRKLGGYEKYWEHLQQNDIAAPVYEAIDKTDPFTEYKFIGLRKIIHPVSIQKKVGRNELCPCKSGKKYKKCCINKK